MTPPSCRLRVLVQIVAALAAVVLASCSPDSQEAAAPPPEGPPSVSTEVVARHAAELDGSVGARPAGSQQEQLAATYILGHLQRAGYGARLDGVPVADLVRSTNVIAVPPSGGDPRVLVVTAYDRPPGAPPNGAAVGTLLEVARALRVETPAHDVGFAALGAETTPVREGNLGSRRMARLLADEGGSPEIVVIGSVTSRGAPVIRSLGDAGTGGSGEAADGISAPVRATANVFDEAGLKVAVAEGDPTELGAALLDYLAGEGTQE